MSASPLSLYPDETALQLFQRCKLLNLSTGLECFDNNTFESIPATSSIASTPQRGQQQQQPKQHSTPKRKGCLLPGDIVEIFGQSGTGKSRVLLHTIASCILPKRWRGVDIAGNECDVVVFSFDGQFRVNELARIIESRVTKRCSQHQRQQQQQQQQQHRSRRHWKQEQKPQQHQQSRSPSDVEALMEKCLARVHVYECVDSMHFIAALHLLSSYLDQTSNDDLNNGTAVAPSTSRTHPPHQSQQRQWPDPTVSSTTEPPEELNIRVVFVDGVTSLFWRERVEKMLVPSLRFDQQRAWINLLKTVVFRHNLILFLTKSALFSKQRYGKGGGGGGGRAGSGADDGGGGGGGGAMALEHHVEVFPREWSTCVRLRLHLTSAGHAWLWNVGHGPNGNNNQRKRQHPPHQQQQQQQPSLAEQPPTLYRLRLVASGVEVVRSDA